MSKADRDGGGAGVGPSGGSGGGSGGGTSPGNDTPGHPSAADGRRGSTMGTEGGTAPDSSNRDGSQTPGSPENAGRRGAVAGESVSARESARRARDSLKRQGNYSPNLGMGTDYNFAKELKTKEDEGTMSPRERDMRIGMVDGQQAQIGAQALGVTGVIGKMAPSVPGMSAEGVVAGLAEDGFRQSPSTPETNYGAAHAKQHTQNTGLQSAAEVGAGLALGPVGAAAARGINVAVNDRRSRSEMGIDAPSPSPTNPTAGNGTGGGPSRSASTANARASMQNAPNQNFSAPVINRDSYSKGLLSLAQKIR